MKFTHIIALVALVIVTTLYNTSKASEGLYVEIGITRHNIQLDAPEYTGNNPLGNLGFGYVIQMQEQYYVDVFYRHTSSIPDFESGYGLNQIGIQLRKYFK